MMKFDLDENDYLAEFNYTANGEQQKIVLDCVEADKYLTIIGDTFNKTEDKVQGLKDFDNAWREYLAKHGGQDVPDALLYQMIGYVPFAVEEFKKKLPPTVQSHLSMESTPSTFEQLREGHLKLASMPSSPSESSESVASQPTLPQAGSRN